MWSLWIVLRNKGIFEPIKTNPKSHWQSFLFPLSFVTQKIVLQILFSLPPLLLYYMQAKICGIKSSD